MTLDYDDLDAEKKRINAYEMIQISEVQEDQNWISVMETIVAAIKKIHEEIFTPTITNEVTQNKLENLMADMQTAAFKLRERLYNMERNIEKEEETYKSPDEVPLTNKSKPERLRAMRMKHSTLKQQFSTIMQEYNSIQLEYRNKCRDSIRRQLHFSGQEVTDQELEVLLEQPLGTVFTSLKTQEAQLKMNDVEARHRDIINVEQSIREMQGLFLNLSIIVEKQQYIVDHIEFNVSKTENVVERSKIKLQVAAKNKNKVRRKLLVGLVGAIVVLLMIIFMVPK